MVTSSTGLTGPWASPSSALTACMGQATAKDFTVFYVILGVLLVCLLVPPTRPSDLEEHYEARVLRQRRRELWADKLVFWGGQTWELTGRGRRLPNPLALTWHSFWRSGTWRADAWYHLCNHHVQLSLLFADRLGPYGHVGHKCAWLLCALVQLLSVLVLSRALSVKQCWIVLGLAVPCKLLLTQNTVLHTLLLRCGGSSFEGSGSAVVMAQGSSSNSQQEAALLQSLQRQASRRLLVFTTLSCATSAVLALLGAALTAVLSPSCNDWWAPRGGAVAGGSVLGWWVLGQGCMGVLSLLHCTVPLWPCASLSLTLGVWGKGRGVPLLSVTVGLWRRQLLLSLFHPSTRLAPSLHAPLINDWAKALPCPPAPPLSRAAPPSDFWSAVLAAIDVPLWPKNSNGSSSMGPSNHRPWLELRACRLPPDLCVPKGVLNVDTYPTDLPLAPPPPPSNGGHTHMKHGSLTGSTGSSPTSHASNSNKSSSSSKTHKPHKTSKGSKGSKGGSGEASVCVVGNKEEEEDWHKAALTSTTTLTLTTLPPSPSSAPGAQMLRMLGLGSTGRRKKKKKALAVILDAHSPAHNNSTNSNSNSSTAQNPLRRRSVDLDRRRVEAPHGKGKTHTATQDHEDSGSDSPSGVLSPVLAATHPPTSLSLRQKTPPPLSAGSPRSPSPMGPSMGPSSPSAVPMKIPNKLEHLSITAGLDRATAKEVLAVQLASKASRRRKSQLLSGDMPQRRASQVTMPTPTAPAPVLPHNDNERDNERDSAPPSPSPLQEGDEPFAFSTATGGSGRSRASVRGLGLGGVGAQGGGEEGEGEEGVVRLRNAASLSSSSSSDDDYDDTHHHKQHQQHHTAHKATPAPLPLTVEEGRRRASLAVNTNNTQPTGRRASLSPVAFKTLPPPTPLLLPPTPGLTPTSSQPREGPSVVGPLAPPVSPSVSVSLSSAATPVSPVHRRRMSAMAPITVVYAEDEQDQG